MPALPILLFIPVYNCEKQIVRVLQSLATRLPKSVSEIIIVDNRSKDGTVERIREFKEAGGGISLPPLKVLQNHENYGLGGSHKVAYGYALQHGFAGVVTLHGDDQADLADFSEVIDLWANRELVADTILGSRFSRHSCLEGYSIVRTLGNWVINAIWSVVLFRSIPDLGSGLNFISADAIHRLDLETVPDTLLFNSGQLLELIRVNARIIFYPIRWRENDQISNAIPWKVFWGEVKQVLKYKFCYPATPINPAGRGTYGSSEIL